VPLHEEIESRQGKGEAILERRPRPMQYLLPCLRAASGCTRAGAAPCASLAGHPKEKALCTSRWPLMSLSPLSPRPSTPTASCN